MKMSVEIPGILLAPCGMNCALCYAYLRKKKSCHGCRAGEDSQPGHCRKCSRRECATGQGIDFCFECSSFPCDSIKRLDKSYRQRYQASLVENGIRIQSVGIPQFLWEERKKWTCPQCGGTICIHDRTCSECATHMESGS
jgi:hypothetical protein